MREKREGERQYRRTDRDGESVVLWGERWKQEVISWQRTVWLTPSLFWTELPEPEEEEIDSAKTRVQQCREQKEMERRSNMLIRQMAKELYDSLFSTKELQEQKGERRERDRRLASSATVQTCHRSLRFFWCNWQTDNHKKCLFFLHKYARLHQSHVRRKNFFWLQSMLSRKKEAFCCYNQSIGFQERKKLFVVTINLCFQERKKFFGSRNHAFDYSICRQGPEEDEEDCDCLRSLICQLLQLFFLSFFLFCSVLFSLIKNHVSENFNGNNWGRKPKFATKKLKKNTKKKPWFKSNLPSVIY